MSCLMLITGMLRWLSCTEHHQLRQHLLYTAYRCRLRTSWTTSVPHGQLSITTTATDTQMMLWIIFTLGTVTSSLQQLLLPLELTLCSEARPTDIGRSANPGREQALLHDISQLNQAPAKRIQESIQPPAPSSRMIDLRREMLAAQSGASMP